WMRVFYPKEMKPLVYQTLSQYLVLATTDKDHLTATVLPSLPYSQATHQMASAELCICIRSNK
ncbi:hypothetical protein ABTC40_19340, partial [Acinetobacter baumannii]